jgi:parallel beta-helix repeat protein
MKHIFALIFILLLLPKAWANVYYVATNGNDSNNGTAASPWLTIQQAANTAQAGDLVYVKAGTYNERLIISHSGTASNEIIFKNYQDDLVIIDGTSITWTATWNGLLDISDKSYIKIIGLRLINAVYAGIFMENAHHITINNCQTNNTFSSGIAAWNSYNIVISNNAVTQACDGGEQECITLSNTYDSQVFNNEVSNNGNPNAGGEGIDIKQGSHNVQVYNNWVHNLNNKVGIYIDAWDSHTYNIEVYQNKVNNCTETGIAIASEFGGLLENVQIHTNISFNNKYDGIQIGGWKHPDYTGTATPIKHILITNNTCYNNGSIDGGFGFGVTIDNAYAEDITVRNNILSQNSAQLEEVQMIGTAVMEYNLIDGDNATTNAVFGSNYIEHSPDFEDAPNADFHLKHTSWAIDAGTNTAIPNLDFEGNSRPFNGTVDIGAYEFHGILSNGAVLEDTFQLEVGPNPFSEMIYVNVYGSHEPSCHIALYNASGALTYHEILYNVDNKVIIQPKSHLKTGFYYLKIQFENSLLESFKLIKH